MKGSKTLLLFILPGFLIYFIFFILPACSTLFYSFTNWNGMAGENFQLVGFENFGRLGKDTIFKTSFLNNIKFMLFVVIVQFICSLAFSIFLQRNTKSNVFLRALYFFPTILSSVSVSFIWLFMYDPNIGVLNTILSHLGMEGINWLGNKDLAIFSIAIVQTWFHTGQMIVIFVAGLNSIPREMFEVAIMEGASRWHTFSKVIWPLIAPAAVIVSAYTTIQSFKAFDLIFSMTRGGPNYATEILSTFIYSTAFVSSEFGYASSISIIFMIIVAFITLVQFRLLKADRVNY
jgi:raffinose/stachyose/melibiose transport system permease protein